MIVHRSFIPLWISLALTAGAVQAVTVEQIPSPRPSGWVVDLTGTLPVETVTGLNELSSEVQARTGADLVVVVIPTTDGADPHDFATRLFNAWKLGSRRHNSILVFAALDDRAAEIVLGDSLNTETGNRESQDIMQGVMIPWFRQGDPAGAIWQGTNACADRFLGVAPNAETAEVQETAGAPEPAAPLPSVEPAPIPPAQNFRYEPETGLSGNQRDFIAVSIPVTIAGAVVLGLWLLARTPRCSRCRQKMTMLGEAEDDDCLEPSEQAEERVGSINHQVWVCPTCGETKKRRLMNFTSDYKKCPECSARTLRSTSFTLREADYSQGGEVQVDQTCANCPYSRTYTYGTPILQMRSYDDDNYRRSSSSWSSSSLFDSSSSSSSSSHDSGSSSGGGDHSSGGGASGRW